MGAFYTELGLGGDHRGHTGITQRVDIWGKYEVKMAEAFILTFMSNVVFFTSRYCFIKYKNLLKPFLIVSKIGYYCHSHHHHLIRGGDVCLFDTE